MSYVPVGARAHRRVSRVLCLSAAIAGCVFWAGASQDAWSASAQPLAASNEAVQTAGFGVAGLFGIGDFDDAVGAIFPGFAHQVADSDFVVGLIQRALEWAPGRMGRNAADRILRTIGF